MSIQDSDTHGWITPSLSHFTQRPNYPAIFYQFFGSIQAFLFLIWISLVYLNMQKDIDYFQKYSPICIVDVLGAVKNGSQWLEYTVVSAC